MVIIIILFFLIALCVLSEAMIRRVISRDDGKELETDNSSNEMCQHFLGLSKTMISSQSSCWFTSHIKFLLNGATSVVRQLQKEMTPGIIETLLYKHLRYSLSPPYVQC